MYITTTYYFHSPKRINDILQKPFLAAVFVERYATDHSKIHIKLSYQLAVTKVLLLKPTIKTHLAPIEKAGATLHVLRPGFLLKRLAHCSNFLLFHTSGHAK